MADKNIPPTDGKHYWFNEDAQAWIEVQLDSNGFALTPDRILALKPYPSWVRNEDNTAWVPPIPKPDDVIDADGNIQIGYSWDEGSLAWVDISKKPYPSWILNEDNQFVSPVPKPDDGIERIWSEVNLKWVRDPKSFASVGEAFWDEKIKDFISVLDVIGFARTENGIDARFKEQQWPSWTQGEDGMWRAPVAYPDTGKYTYTWDEYEQEWFDQMPELSGIDTPHEIAMKERMQNESNITG